MYAYQLAEVSFRKISEIGQEGKNSKVYRIHDRNMDAELVIKEVEKKSGDFSPDYFEEAQILYKSSHPNVVQVSYVCEDDNNVYIATPYYKNGSLKSLMATRFLTVREIIRYSSQFLSGLQNIHSKKLIHFDIKPDNVLLSDRNEALLSDFGQAKPINLHGLAQQSRLYQKQYPPEVFGNSSHTYDNRFDIYQVGLTMYRMCIGDVAFNEQLSRYTTWEGFGGDVRNGKFPDRKAYPLHIPKKLQTVINKCLKPDPGQRYGSPIEVVNALADIDGSILDWQYTLEDDKRIWEQEVDGTRKFISVCQQLTSIAYKHKASSTPRRVREFCKTKISHNDIVEFLTQ